ncbi:MAG: isomerase [Spirochaetes bacterium]|nr:MAG: isomerase [Spirochaetota bacterium]
MYGVSPAYFFSRFTTDFTVRDYIKGLDWLAESGFQGFQLEVFHSECLGEWTDEVFLLRERASGLGMTATQFVAHFLLYTTREERELLSDAGYEEMKAVAEICSAFPSCTTVTLPLAPFQLPSKASVNPESWRRLWDGLCSRLLRYAAIVEGAGLRLALEIVPGSLLGGTEGLLRFAGETGNSTIGFNFDTGHAWSSKEAIALLPAKLAGRIYGTHLKDNFGTENLALPPGEGSIPWESVMAGLVDSGYRGSFDLEIACPSPNEVEGSYLRGKSVIENAYANANTRRAR